jgi:uncharacterized protein (TIGR03083 family)
MLLPAVEPLGPFDPRPLFCRTRRSLLELLESLTPDGWRAPTAAGSWSVRDVAAHLVGDDLGRLSRSRDDHAPGEPADGGTLPGFLDRHNAEWVAATQRLSPRVLTELLAVSSDRLRAFWEAADLTATGEPVSWAGLGPAPVWLDCARDFTEDWVHQQQIREAVSRPAPDDPAAVGAVIDTFMHAVPRTLLVQLSDDRASGFGADNATISIALRDPAGTPTVWSWRNAGGEWVPSPQPDNPTATVSSTADTWWRLCVRMITPEQARARSQLTGDRRLGMAALRVIAIIRDE